MTSTIGAKLCSALQDIWLHAGTGAVDERFKETLKRAEEVNKEYKANRPRSRRAYVTFKGLDTNNDGFISQDEFKSIHSRGNFKNIDVDGDGKISREEFDQKGVNNLEGKGHDLRYAVFEFVCMCECVYMCAWVVSHCLCQITGRHICAHLLLESGIVCAEICVRM
jgi:hypothetical protein